MNLSFKTKRLQMHPMTDEELQQIIDEMRNEGRKQFYVQMLEAGKSDPDNRVWYVPWSMTLKSNGAFAGEVHFKGPAVNETVGLAFNTNAEYESKGYATEAVKSIIDWAFEHQDIFFVEVESTEGNLACVRILERQGFVRDGEDGALIRFVRTKPYVPVRNLYMCIGLCAGMTFGLVIFDKMIIGMCVGMLFGLCLGMNVDKKNRMAIDSAVARKKLATES